MEYFTVLLEYIPNGLRMIIRKFTNDTSPLPFCPVTFCSRHRQEYINRSGGFRNIAQILYVLEGEGELICNGECHRLRAGSAFYVEPGVSHCYGGERDLVTAWFSFFYTDIDAMRRYMGEKSFWLVEGMDTDHASSQIEKMEREYFGARREGILSAQSYRLVMEFIEFGEDHTLTGMELAVRYMEDHFDRKITVSELADLCYISKSSFCQRFKATYGCTAFEKLMEIRLQNGELLLSLYPDERISDIAKQCGFDDVGYFCKAFKRRFGITPTASKGAVEKAKTTPDPTA